jgi:hypothetical protein
MLAWDATRRVAMFASHLPAKVTGALTIMDGVESGHLSDDPTNQELTIYFVIVL